jgi:tripartite-type tricarboxylate transporter receptor subunit TctC
MNKIRIVMPAPVFVLAASLLAALAPDTALAQGSAYPAKPIRFVVPFPPGGGTDILSRALAQKLSESLGQQVIIDNRPGAGGNIGADLAAKAAPDGYTLVMGQTSNLAINPTLFAKMPYDAAKDFAPITLVTAASLVVVVPQTSSIRSIRDLIAQAKEKPGSINFASPGNGTVGHLVGEMFKRQAGIDMVHVPYKGAAPALTDLLGGQVSVYFASGPVAAGQLKGGRIRAIAVTGGKRSPTMPEVPTVAESGLPGFDASSWYGVLAPAGTPKEIITKLHAESVKAMQSPDLKERMTAEGGEPIGSTPAEFAAFIRSETVKWARVIREAGAKVD